MLQMLQMLQKLRCCLDQPRHRGTRSKRGAVVRVACSSGTRRGRGHTGGDEGIVPSGAAQARRRGAREEPECTAALGTQRYARGTSCTSAPVLSHQQGVTQRPGALDSAPTRIGRYTAPRGVRQRPNKKGEYERKN